LGGEKRVVGKKILRVVEREGKEKKRGSHCKKGGKGGTRGKATRGGTAT